MTFLSKIGGLILKGIAVFGGISGIITQAVPSAGGIVQKISKDLAEIANIVITAEAIGQLKGLAGPDKAKAAGPLVAQIILQSSIMTGKKIADPTLFNQGCVNVAGGVADVLNSLHPDGAVTTDLTQHTGA